MEGVRADLSIAPLPGLELGAPAGSLAPGPAPWAPFHNPLGNVTSPLCFPMFTSGISVLAHGHQVPGDGHTRRGAAASPSHRRIHGRAAPPPGLQLQIARPGSVLLAQVSCIKSSTSLFFALFSKPTGNLLFWAVLNFSFLVARTAWQRFGNLIHNTASIARTVSCVRRRGTGVPVNTWPS